MADNLSGESLDTIGGGGRVLKNCVAFEFVVKISKFVLRMTLNLGQDVMLLSVVGVFRCSDIVLFTIGGLQDNPFLLEHALCESPL